MEGNRDWDYPLMPPYDPPLSEHPFEAFSKAEAQSYLDWYVGQSDERIRVLKACCRETAATEIAFDGTPESLKGIWAWFEEQITIRQKTEEEMQAELRGRPAWMQKEIRKQTWVMSTRTLAMIVDLSFYFAEVFMRNNPSIHWGFFTKPKNLASLNRPVLVGFVKNMDLDPRRILSVCSQRSVEEKDPDRLFKLYQIWTTYIAVH